MKPLDQVRVLDLSHVLAMPYCTMVLGDLGADVIKVERIGEGDDSRHFGPWQQGESAYFMSVNRNKRSVALDLKSTRGKTILEALIAKSDVLTENYKPGTLAKLGFPYDTIRALNPRIVYASISGFGADSTHPGRPGYDIIAQAYAGFMSITGHADTPPTRAGASIADIVSGLFTAVGILGALRCAAATGLGQRLDMAMTDCVLAVLENAVVRHTVSGDVPGRIGSRHPAITPFDVFRTTDGYVVIAAGNDRLWQQLCNHIEPLRGLRDDKRFETNAARTRNEPAVKAAIEAWTSSLPTPEVVAVVGDKAGVPCAPVNSIDQVVADPNTAHRRMLAHFEHPVAGSVTTANNPINLSATPCKAHTRAPLLGEHTRAVLRDVLAYDDAAIAALLRDGVAAAAD